MPHYRIHFLNPAGRTDAFNAADCASDVEAAAEAKRLLRKHPAAEVWCDSRKVGRVHRAEGDVLIVFEPNHGPLAS
jgi:hypothetical protein